MNSKELPSALVAVDICIFKIISNKLCVYLMEVENNFYKNQRCLPGGLILLDESADDTQERIIKNKTTLDISNMYTEQLYTFSSVKRDLRSRVVSVAYMALYSGEIEEGFVDIESISRLAYDHIEILKVGVERLKSKLEYTTIVQKMIQEEFTYSQLQKVYEIILGEELDKRNFRKKIESLNIVSETGKTLQEGRMRPAALYRFNNDQVENINLF